MLKEKFNDLGFGTKTGSQKTRLMNQDGSFTVERRGLNRFDSFSMYHFLIEVNLWKFLLVMLLGYFLMNLAFALGYVFIGVEHLAGAAPKTFVEDFIEAFFFSTQTFTTVGYGRISPQGFGANVLASIESFVGLLAFAVATGLLYGRFAKPKSNIIYSKNALIAPYAPTGQAFMFRMANRLKHTLIDTEAQITLAYLDKENPQVRKFSTLNLERTKITMLPSLWTIVHPIDAESPLYGLTEDDFEKLDMEFLVMLRAYDEIFSQTVHSRFSFKYYEVVWNAKFVQALNYSDANKPYMELDKLNDYEKLS